MAAKGSFEYFWDKYTEGVHTSLEVKKLAHQFYMCGKQVGAMRIAQRANEESGKHAIQQAQSLIDAVMVESKDPT